MDYKLVNAVTAGIEDGMPLVDDMLTKIKGYQWFCSLDAASKFWDVMMTDLDRHVSAFMCTSEHFEWLPMPFGLKIIR